jgi:hypothetical protein
MSSITEADLDLNNPEVFHKIFDNPPSDQSVTSLRKETPEEKEVEEEEEEEEEEEVTTDPDEENGGIDSTEAIPGSASGSTELESSEEEEEGEASTPKSSEHSSDGPSSYGSAYFCDRFYGLEKRKPRDHLRSNALDLLRKPPKIPVPREVYNRKGDTRNWCDSGMCRRYVYGKNFGKVPNYLLRIKQELYEDQLRLKRMIEEKCGPLGCCQPCTCCPCCCTKEKQR